MKFCTLPLPLFTHNGHTAGTQQSAALPSFLPSFFPISISTLLPCQVGGGGWGWRETKLGERSKLYFCLGLADLCDELTINYSGCSHSYTSTTICPKQNFGKTKIWAVFQPYCLARGGGGAEGGNRTEMGGKVEDLLLCFLGVADPFRLTIN